MAHDHPGQPDILDKVLLLEHRNVGAFVIVHDSIFTIDWEGAKKMSATGVMVANKAIDELCTVKTNIFGKITGYEANYVLYVLGGETPEEGLDCQGVIEYVLRELGITASYRGTNHMWREMFSEKGTIADGVEKHGEIPIGACILICDYDTTPNGYSETPDCNHIYLKIADGYLLHASSSNGKLMIRDFADKAIPNGGPTHYGLIAGITYDGISATETNAGDTETAVVQQSVWKPLYSHLRFQKGDKGNGTREIQTGLNKLGYGLTVDGDFGTLTDSAVRKFQEEHSLTADGIVGENTWAALIDAVNAV